jgi:hypothetical protein
MTVIREKDIIMPETIDEPFDYSEIFDVTKFPISAECCLFDKELAW